MRPSLTVIAPLMSLALGCASTQTNAPAAPPQDEASRIADCERRFEAMQRAERDANSDPRVLVNDRTRDLPPRTSNSATNNPCRQHGQSGAGQSPPASREDEVAIARTRARAMLNRGQPEEALGALKPAFYEGAPAADADLRELITEIAQAMKPSPAPQCVGTPIPLSDAAPKLTLALSEPTFQVRCPLSDDQRDASRLSVQVAPRGGAPIEATAVERDGAWAVVSVTMPASLQGQRAWLDLTLVHTPESGAPARLSQGQLIWFSPDETSPAPPSVP